MSARLERMVALGREMGRAWLTASISRTAWSLPLPLVLLLAVAAFLWLSW